MLVLRRYARGGSLLVLSLIIGCGGPDRPLALDPGEVGLAASGPAGLDPPSNLTAAAVSKSQIDLAWQDKSSQETGFEVHRSTTGPAGTFTALATTGANVTAHSDVGLTPLTQYCYKVRALRVTGGNTKYSNFSNTACATTPGPPPAPSNADARPASSSAVDVSWADNSLTEDGFRVERSAASTGPWETVATTGTNMTTYADGGRASEQQVCYRAVAFNAHGESGPSNADCTTPPAGPTSLTAATAASGVDLTWADNSGVEDGYEVQRSEDGVTFGVIAQLAANVTSYHDAGAASSSTTYWYRVRANKDDGFSDFSNTASAQGGCTPTGPEMCGNGVDDDCDGYENWDDPEGCSCEVQDCGFDFCPPGYICGFDGCCVSHCNDGVQNADEGDVDCGGSCATKCKTGQSCWVNADCASGVCYFGKCK